METIQGDERLFDVDDVFFSTTDTKGVIRGANNTFITPSPIRDRSACTAATRESTLAEMKPSRSE